MVVIILHYKKALQNNWLFSLMLLQDNWLFDVKHGNIVLLVPSSPSTGSERPGHFTLPKHGSLTLASLRYLPLGHCASPPEWPTE